MSSFCENTTYINVAYNIKPFAILSYTIDLNIYIFWFKISVFYTVSEIRAALKCNFLRPVYK